MTNDIKFTDSPVNGWKYPDFRLSFSSGQVNINPAQNVTLGDFDGHSVAIGFQDDEYVVSCPLCGRRVEVAGDYTPGHLNAAAMYALGWLMHTECDNQGHEVLSEVTDQYIGKRADSDTFDALADDLMDALTTMAEREDRVLRHEK